MLTTLLAPNPSGMTLDGTRTFIVGRERPAVIDPGPDDPRHHRAVMAALGGRSPVAILLTHLHADHAGGADALARATGAPVRVLDGGSAGPEGPRDRRLRPDEEVATDAGTLRVVPTPGHAPEHACFLWTHGPTAPAILFAGDMFMGGADTTLVAPPEGDLGAYLASLDRIARLDPARILPAHGEAIDDPREAIARYRAHRDHRIAGVVRALREAGPSRPARLVGPVYGPDLPPGLVPAAEGSLRAVLAHLASIGMVVEEEDGRFRIHPGSPR
jgi:glyoxylase-like metal-dependent hydrolase (beta-lactamase superfamily II)